MEQPQFDLKLYYLNESIISWITLSTLKPNKLKIPSDYLIQDILQIPNNRLIINGAKRVEEGHKEHTIFIYDSNDMIEMDTHKFGIVGFKMIFNDEKVFFLSDKKCQVYCLSSERYSNIAEMLSTHINPGCCSFDEGIVVVGGLNNKDIEVYRPELNAWLRCGRLEFDMFGVSCVQISRSQVLIVSYKEYFKLDVHLGKIVFREMLPVKSKTSKVGNLVHVNDYVYCVFGCSIVLRYCISLNKWIRLQKSSGKCCLII